MYWSGYSKKENQCHTFSWEPGRTLPNTEQQWLVLNTESPTPLQGKHRTISKLTHRWTHLISKSRATILGDKMCFRCCASLPVQTFLFAPENHPRIKLQRASRAWGIQPILCQRNGAENCVWQTRERHFIKEFRPGTIGLRMSPALSLAQLSCGGSHKARPWGEQCCIQQGGVYPLLGGRIGVK